MNWAYNTGVKLKQRMDGTRTEKIANDTHRGWVMVRAARDLWRMLRDDCRAIPRRAWWRWGGILAIGFALCCGVSYVVARVTQNLADHHGVQAWDERWIVW